MTEAAKTKTETLRFTVHVPEARLDKYVAETVPQFSRSRVQKLIEQSHILVNGQKAKASQRLDENDEVTVEIIPPVYPVAEPDSLVIIYEDKDVVVVLPEYA